MTVSIRRAVKGDAPHIAALMDIAGHGIESEFWAANRDGDHSALSAIRTGIIADTSLPYHLSKVFLLETEGEVAAGLVGSLVTDPEIPGGFPPCFAPLLELESRVVGYWTVVAIAVYPEFRGRGFAHVLLDHARSRAEMDGAEGLSIVVEDSNAAALSLYRRWGFREFGSLPWLSYAGRTGPERWLLLTLPFRPRA